MAIRKRITNRPITLSDIANMGWSEGHVALAKLYPQSQSLEERADHWQAKFWEIFETLYDGGLPDDTGCVITMKQLESMSAFVENLNGLIKEADNEIYDLKEALDNAQTP